MIPYSCIIPSFKLSQVNTREADGSNIPHLEALTSNVVANIEAFEDRNPIHDQAIFICVREKMDNGDYRYGIAGIPVDKNDCDVVEVILSGFEKLPHIAISRKCGIADVIRRVLKNLVFS